MLKIFSFLILFVYFVNCKAQSSYRVFLTENGEKTGQIQLATSFAIVTPIPEDSAWFVRQFDMKDSILSSGYYKDEQLTILHGKFVYYHKVSVNRGYSFMGEIVVDTVNRIKSEGYYINGLKTGTWLEYFSQGGKSFLNTYDNGLLDGLFQSYDNITGNVVVEGYYVNDKREGDWCMLARDSTAIYTDIYKHGKIVKHLSYINPLQDILDAKNNKSAVPNFELSVLLSRKFEHYNFTIPHGRFYMSFVVTKEGKIINPKVIESYEPEFDNIVLQATLNSKWKSALKNGQPVDQVQYYTINIVNSTALFNDGYTLHKKYNLQTGELH